MEAAVLVAIGAALMVAGFMLGTLSAIALIFIGRVVLGVGLGRVMSS